MTRSRVFDGVMPLPWVRRLVLVGVALGAVVTEVVRLRADRAGRS